MSHNFPLIVVDESVDHRIVMQLIREEFSVYSITTEMPGITDTEVIAVSVELNGFILTEDKDFGDELVYRKPQNIGSMLLRIHDMSISDKIKLIIDTFNDHSKDLKGNFSVLTSKKLRIRKYSL